MHSLVSFIVIIMFVNILTCLTTRVEIASTINSRPLNSINHRNDLKEEKAKPLSKHPKVVTSTPSPRPITQSTTTTTSSLPTITNSTGNIQSRLTDIILNNFKLHQSEIDNDKTTSATTPSQLDEDDEFNKLYLQSSLTSNLFDFATTPSTRDSLMLADADQDKLSHRSDQNLQEFPSDNPLAPSSSVPAGANESTITIPPVILSIVETSNTTDTATASTSQQIQNSTETNLELKENSTPLQNNPTNEPHLIKPRSEKRTQQLPTVSQQQPISLQPNNTLQAMTKPSQAARNMTLINATDKPPSLNPNSLLDILNLIRHLNLIQNASKLLQYSISKQPIPIQQASPINWLPNRTYRRSAPPIRAVPTPLELLTAESLMNSRIDRSNLSTIMREGIINYESAPTILGSRQMDQFSSKEDKTDYFPTRNTRYLVSPYSANFDNGFTSYNRLNANRDHYLGLTSDGVRTLAPGQNMYEQFGQRQKFNQPQARPMMNQDGEQDNQQQQHNSQQLAGGSSFGLPGIGSKIFDYAREVGASSNHHEQMTKQMSRPIHDMIKTNPSPNLYNEEQKDVMNKLFGPQQQLLNRNKPMDAGDGGNKEHNLTIKIQHSGKRDNLYSQFTGESAKDNEENAFVIKVKKANAHHQQHQNEMDTFIDGEKLPVLNMASGPDEQLSLHGLNYQLFGEDQTASTNLPRPLTIGEIVGQHGVPFRLKSPYGESYNLDSALRNTKMPPQAQGSNNIEDLIYMPYNPTRLSEVTGFKMDQELKKNLAFKTIEALTRDPDLSTSIFDNLYSLNQATSASPSWQKLPPLGGENGLHSNYFTNPASLLPMASTSDQTYTNGPMNFVDHSPPPPLLSAPSSSLASLQPVASAAPASNTHHLAKFNSSNPLSMMFRGMGYRWTLSKMPDLIPIPLAATVPGYLIKMPDGRILAAALTNAFSIQGIQKGPLTAGYKNFLNQRLKSLIKPNVAKPVNFGAGGPLPGTFPVVAGSTINSMVLPPPKYQPLLVSHLNKINSPNSGGGSNNYDKGGLFSRGLLNQLGFKSFNLPTTRPREVRKRNKLPIPKVSMGLIPGSPMDHQHPSLNNPSPIDHQTPDMSALPIATANDPIFEFGDESQIVETPADHSSFSTDTTDVFQNENKLAIKAKLNQLLSFKNLFGVEDLFQGNKRRRSPARMQNIRACLLAEK